MRAFFVCLRQRMVDLEDRILFRKFQLPEREGIEPRAENDVLLCAGARRGFQHPLGVCRAAQGRGRKVRVDKPPQNFLRSGVRAASLRLAYLFFGFSVLRLYKAQHCLKLGGEHLPERFFAEAAHPRGT